MTRLGIQLAEYSRMEFLVNVHDHIATSKGYDQQMFWELQAVHRLFYPFADVSDILLLTGLLT